MVVEPRPKRTRPASNEEIKWPQKEMELTKNIAYCEAFAGDPWIKIGADVPPSSVSDSVNGSRAC